MRQRLRELEGRVGHLEGREADLEGEKGELERENRLIKALLPPLSPAAQALRNWPAIAERLGTGRTPSAVEDHWRRHTGRRAQE